MDHVTWLLERGFTKIAKFKWNDGACDLIAKTPISNSPFVYIFVQNKSIKYVGSADRLRQRLRAYQSRQSKGLTEKSRLVHRMMSEALLIRSVDVFAFPITDTIILVNNLPLDVLLGLESALISLFEAPWNHRGRDRIIVENPQAVTFGEIAALKKQFLDLG